MQGHVRVCSIDGLNIGNTRFNWNNRIIIFHNEESESNLANVQLIFDTPYRYKKVAGDLPDEENQDQGKAFELLSIFLTCYHLANDLPIPEIMMNTWSAMNLENIESIDNIKFTGFIQHGKSKFDTVIDSDYVHDALNNTSPLFEKVMNVPEQRRKPLTTALTFYHLSKHAKHSFTKFLDLVTVLESLFTENDGELKYKFALRTSLFHENDPVNRKKLYTNLHQIYKDRSNLVHGNYISLNPKSMYDERIEYLTPIIFNVFPKYIEYMSSGLSKKDILKLIDNMALGMDKDFKPT